VEELHKRGWTNKRWQTRKGHHHGGKLFNKVTLHQLLTNVVYLGKIRYKREVHDGEHAAIVTEAVWKRVQALLRQNAPPMPKTGRQRSSYLLKGLLRCANCECAMTPTHSTRRGVIRYRYYRCLNAVKRGRSICPVRSVPAPEIERFVLAQIPETIAGPAKKEAPPSCLPLSKPILRNSWSALSEEERASRLRACVRIVHYDGAGRKVRISFQSPPTDGSSKEAVIALVTEKAFSIQRRRRHKAMVEPPAPVKVAPGRLPRITRLIALAIRFEQLLRERKVASYSALAKLGHVSRARMTQIMNLLGLAPDIQEELLFLPRVERYERFHLRRLQPIARLLSWRQQRECWHRLQQQIARKRS
jgi:hypothetical protein